MTRLTIGVKGALAVFFVAGLYYSLAALHLPLGSGTDAPANYAAAAFYTHHHRLAVFPKDENDPYLKYSPYGTTRLLRPPLSFLASTIVSPFVPIGKRDQRTSIGSHEWHISLRWGSVLLCSLTVVWIFLGLYWYFANPWYAFLGSALVGLLPQFTFIAAHLNDDSSAIFSASMLFAVLILVYRQRANLLTVLLLGISIGLVLISKLSAWILLPAIALAMLAFVRFEIRKWLSYLLVFSFAVLLGGGWWPLFNVTHYGIDDPLARNINREIASRHRTMPLDEGRGFISQGVGLRQLIVTNHKDFIGASIKSTIGNLDWLKIRLGPLQYSFYVSVAIIGLIYFLMRALFICIRFWTGTLRQQDVRQFLFECVLGFAIIFQVLVYSWRNVYEDIQVQGKYILPAMFPMLILFMSGTRAVAHSIQDKIGAPGYGRIVVNRRQVFRIAAASLILVTILVHVDGLLRFVHPFYWPPAYRMSISDVDYLDLKELTPAQTNEDLSIILKEGKWVLTSTGQDPQLFLPSRICGSYGKTFLVQVSLNAQERGKFQIFLDDGTGYSAGTFAPTDVAVYGTGEQTILLGLSADRCQSLRLDPMLGPGQITIESIGFLRMSIRAPRYPGL
ncbi:MAG: hypothetical protein VX690_02010 [Pseudomonadota bacterium]|nr:hypothetical protein [Pseudomonadota bacterium]